ncbi:MAG: hypothetical protein M1825_004808 [Sarcosagium campestre]|nr:MAG: hypothetical protein M1825_004808 [Sarcosagium campestre]
MIFHRFVLPGDSLDPAELATLADPSAPLRLGPGLRHASPNTISSTLAGDLWTDKKKNALWVERNGGRYIPTTGDTVLVTVHHSAPDYFQCSITPHTSLAQLGHLAFEGATRKSRPQLVPGSLVYARVSLADKHLDPELECVSASTGRADGLGPLKGGMVFDISVGMARRLMMSDLVRQGGVVVLEACAERIPFEVAVGRNGRFWVDAGAVVNTLAVGRAVSETDEKGLGIEEQRKLVARLLKDI